MTVTVRICSSADDMRAFARDLQRGLASPRRDRGGRTGLGAGVDRDRGLPRRERRRGRGIRRGRHRHIASRALPGLHHGAAGPARARCGQRRSSRRCRHGHGITALKSSRRRWSRTTRRASRSRYGAASASIRGRSAWSWTSPTSRTAGDRCPPEGVEIVLFADRPELAAGAYEVGSRGVPDIPGGEDWTPPPFEQFVELISEGSPIFVAVADGEVVGYAKLREKPAAIPRRTA